MSNLQNLGRFLNMSQHVAIEDVSTARSETVPLVEGC